MIGSKIFGGASLKHRSYLAREKLIVINTDFIGLLKFEYRVLTFRAPSHLLFYLSTNQYRKTKKKRIYVSYVEASTDVSQ